MIRFKSKAPRPATPELTALLDVMFILLIFFVVSAVVTVKGLDMELPEAESARAVTGKTMEIVLQEDGSILCDTKPMTLDVLSSRLLEVAAKPFAMQPEHILLKSSPRANVGHFVAIMDQVRNAGFDNLAIVAEAPGTTRRTSDGEL